MVIASGLVPNHIRRGADGRIQADVFKATLVERFNVDPEPLELSIRHDHHHADAIRLRVSPSGEGGFKTVAIRDHEDCHSVDSSMSAVLMSHIAFVVMTRRTLNGDPRPISDADVTWLRTTAS